MTEGVDQDARDMANRALAKINSHEDVCGERWRAANSQLQEVKNAIHWNTAQMWAAQGFVIVLLLSMVGWLITRLSG